MDRTEDTEDTGMRPRTAEAGRRTAVWIASVDSDEPQLLFATAELLLEAPNWSHDGRSLLLNGAGRLWRLDVGTPSGLVEIPLDGVPDINNDHVLSPDGRTVYVSGMDGHLYAAPAAGGKGVRLTADDGTLHFLHGVSPDGRTLAYVEIARGVAGSPGRLALMPAAGGPGKAVDTGEGHLDGPEYSPDGEWIYCNTETFTEAPGHAQIARLPAAGSVLRRVHTSDTVDWFPHLSPDGVHAAYVSFPPGTLGHPANLDVTVRLVRTDAWAVPVRTFPLFGGQGTMNVNSWSPDSRRFAFVSYPLDGRAG
ncbi:TolB family protein [Streptomyces sp. NBC_00370]|uniref:TolB family protein n=1 Tax=Streptomyces sp. NBC_00370 TaxID=2975728 RepID=UPI002E26B12B